MRRRKKPKNVLIKRIFYSSGVFDYILKDKETAEKIIESTHDGRKRDCKFERAEWNVVLVYKIKSFFKNKHFTKILWLIIGVAIALLGKYIYDKWVKP